MIPVPDKQKGKDPDSAADEQPANGTTRKSLNAYILGVSP
jgi:hypothetical protein